MIDFIHPKGMHFFNIKIDEPGGGGYSGSRDFYGVNLPCKVTACPCNSREKCQMPSKVEIGADGMCKFGKIILAGQQAMK